MVVNIQIQYIAILRYTMNVCYLNKYLLLHCQSMLKTIEVYNKKYEKTNISEKCFILWNDHLFLISNL